MTKLKRATRVIRRQLPFSAFCVNKAPNMFIGKLNKSTLIARQARGWLAMNQHLQGNLRGAATKHCCLLSGRRGSYIKHFRLTRTAARNSLKYNVLAELKPFSK